MKKLIPIALVLLLIAAAYVKFGLARPETPRHGATTSSTGGAMLPASAGPSLSTAPFAAIPESPESSPSAVATQPAGAPAVAGPTPEQIAAENELLASFGTQGTTPETLPGLGWYPAQTWIVDAWTYRMQDGDGGSWDEKPTSWRFKVEGREFLEGRDVWVLAAEPVELKGLPYNPGGKVYVAVDDHSIVALRDRIQENGAVRERFMTLEEGETSAVSTLLPVEMPPTGIEGRGRETKSGILPPNPLRPDPKFDAPKSSGNVVDVEFEADGVTVKQRWDAASPYWPLYSRTPSRVTVLRK